jgi:hypothetical protein
MLDDFMRILRTPDMNDVKADFATQVKYGLVTENKALLDYLESHIKPHITCACCSV